MWQNLLDCHVFVLKTSNILAASLARIQQMYFIRQPHPAITVPLPYYFRSCLQRITTTKQQHRIPLTLYRDWIELTKYKQLKMVQLYKPLLLIIFHYKFITIHRGHLIRLLVSKLFGYTLANGNFSRQLKIISVCWLFCKWIWPRLLPKSVLPFDKHYNWFDLVYPFKFWFYYTDLI